MWSHNVERTMHRSGTSQLTWATQRIFVNFALPRLRATMPALSSPNILSMDTWYAPIPNHLQESVRLARIAGDHLSVDQSFARYPGQQPNQNTVDAIPTQERILELRIGSHPGPCVGSPVDNPAHPRNRGKRDDSRYDGDISIMNWESFHGWYIPAFPQP